MGQGENDDEEPGIVYEVFIQQSALREFEALPAAVAHRFDEAMRSLSHDPMTARSGMDIKRLTGSGSAWRLRVGVYRGIYEIDGRRILFTRFGHRSKVYR